MKLQRSVPLWVVPITFFSALGLGVAWKKSQSSLSVQETVKVASVSTECETPALQERVPQEDVPGVVIPVPQGILTVSHSYDGKWLAVLEEGRLSVWDAHTGKRVQTVKVSVDAQQAPFSPDGERILVVGTDAWDMIQWRNAKTLFSVPVFDSERTDKRAYFTPNGKWLVAAGWPDHQVRLLDAFTGKTYRVLQGHESEVISIEIAPQTQQIITATKHKVRLFEADTGKLLSTISHPSWKEGSLAHIGVSSHEKWLVVDDIDYRAYLVDLKTKKVVYEIPDAVLQWGHEDPFSPDETQLALVRYGEGEEGLLGVSVLDTSTYETKFEVEGSQPVWSEDGNHLLTKKDGALLVQDAQNGHLLDRVGGEVEEELFSEIGRGHQGALVVFPYDNINQVRVLWPGSRQVHSYR